MSFKKFKSVRNSLYRDEHGLIHDSHFVMSILWLAKDVLLERCSNLLAHLALKPVVYGIKHVGHRSARLVRRLCALLVYASLHQDAVPVILGNIVDGIGATDVTFRCVANKVHRLRRTRNAMLGASPRLHQSLSKLKGRDLRLAKGVSVQLALAFCEILKGNLKHASERAHAETDMLVSSRPNNIVVGEVEWRTLVKSLAASSKPTALGHGHIQHDLNVTGPVARISKYKDGINDNVVKVSLTRVLELFGRQLSEWCCGGVVLDDVSRGNDIFEAVSFGDETAFLALASNNENSLVLFGHFPHGGVSANELAGLDFSLKLAR